ncbi:MAG: right-handed parallel beta-helix repeat-containing protein [Armatimonadota bacterium]
MFLAFLLGSHLVAHQGSFTITRPFKQGINLIPTKEDLSQPVFEIKGNNKVVDMKGVIFRGTDANVEPDQRKGLGIRVSGNNITIKNLSVHGYKVALIAENCKNLKLIDCDLSYNWKQHLASTLEKEDESDWMSFHQNEKDEWLRYGAGAYFKNVNGFEVKNVKIVGGQSGLMLMNSNNGLVWNNNFSFLSAIGVGMYRSSNNRIMHNSIDYCVRGYSHGVYNRGQDSAGILIYEQSNKNTFAYNSVTHGGDGFFLWAGQSTMDTAKGGCNDNLVYGNDFSHAPTNGIEATFSRNRFVNNLIRECWHGFWTGYSYDTLISGNVIQECEEGIAHEHGQNNTVDFNKFSGNKTDIHIWANATQDPNWGYPKNRDTKSRDWIIDNNTFYGSLDRKILRANRTSGIKFTGNTSFGGTFDVADDVTNLMMATTCLHAPDKTVLPKNAVATDTKFEPMPTQTAMDAWNPRDPEDVFEKDSPEPLKGGRMPFLAEGSRGRKTIMVDEWGPYDFKSPKLWPGPIMKDGSQKYSIFGPAGSWSLKTAEGLEINVNKGQVPGSIIIKPKLGSSEQKLVLEYKGKAFVDYKGNFIKADQAFPLSIRRFDLPIDWRVKFFAFDEKTEDPRTQFAAYTAKSASAGPEFQKTKLDYSGYGKYEKGVPNNYFGTMADGSFTIAPGEYVIELTADDGVRAWLDGKIIVDAWKYQGPTLYTAKVRLGGTHKLKVNHFQLNGYSALQLRIKPVK